MKQEQNSFSRLWTYLKAYQFEVCLSIFLKIISVVMSVVEPFVLGLAITELTQNLLEMANGVPGASLNATYIAIIMTLYWSLLRIRFLLFQLFHDQCCSKNNSGYAK